MPIPAYTYWRLTRWLGPWTKDNQSPAAVSRRRVRIVAQGNEDHLAAQGNEDHLTAQDSEDPIEALVYTPTDRPPIGSYLVAHGLNLRGPDDERCDRFARVLSHAGFLVMCPRLNALTQMRLDASAVAEFSRSLEALIALPEHPRRKLPGIFSISFGSFPALMTAASPKVGHLVGSLVVFGGYADFVDTCRFMMGAAPSGSRDLEPDPTCMAGLAINTAAVLFEDEAKRELTEAWRAFVARVWGAPDMRRPERFSEVALQLAAELPAELMQTFLQGCGVAPGFAARVEEALARTDVEAMDPRAHLHEIRCPVHLFHGLRDDVIPCSQMQVLASALSKANPKTYLTGLYDHSRGYAGTTALAQLPALLKETKTMAQMVHAMVLSGTRPVARTALHAHPV